MKKKSYKKSYPKSCKSENVFRKKKLFKTFISSAKKLYKVEGMNGKQVFTRLSMFDCGSWEDQTCNVFRREWENSINSEAKHKKLFYFSRSWHLLISHLFIPFHFTFSQGEGNSSRREISYFLINFWDVSWEGRDLFQDGGKVGTCEGAKDNSLGWLRNHSQPEAETLEMDFVRKMSFYVAGKVVVKSGKIKFSSASG